MIKATNLSEEDLREIGLDFANYTYQEDDQGMFSFEDPEMVVKYMVAFARFCMNLGVLYTISEKHEGYIAITTPDTKFAVRPIWAFIRELIGGLGWKNCFRFVKWLKKGGDGLEDEMKKQNRKCVVVQLLSIPEQYQHQGYMRPMMEFALQTARDYQFPLVIETDEKLKCDKYCHLGMSVVNKRTLDERHFIYGMICEAP